MENNMQYFLPIVANILRYFLLAGIPFVIFYLLFPEKFSKNKIQSRFAKRKDFIREILHSMQTTFILAGVGILILRTPLQEYTQFYTNLSDYSLWWIPTSVVLGLVIHDTYFYWMHRTVHQPKFYKMIHLLHHKSINPSPWTSYSFHFTEGVLEAMVAPIILVLLPMHPLSLILFTLSSFAINVYGHLGYEIAPRWFRHSFLFEIMNTSTHHNLHHEKVKGNYGLYFRFWDRLMGTENPDYVKNYDVIQERRFSKVEATSFAKKISLPLIIILATFSFTAFSQSSIEGKWKDSDGGGVVLIYEQDGQFFGQILSADQPEDNKKINGRKILVLRNFKKKNEKEFCCGTIFQPKEKRKLSGSLVLQNPNTLKVKGKHGVFSGSRIWKKIPK
ncbi:MAG: sterol desaturase family protein [Saprospiraceae bacterium]